MAINFETANHQKGSVCSVGMVRVRDGEIVASDAFLVKPHASFGQFAYLHMKRHGIKPEHVADAPRWVEVLPRIRHFTQNDYVVAHDANFDASVIKSASHAEGETYLHMSYFCTLDLARNAVPHLLNHKLKTVAKALKLGDFQHHDAEQDAIAAAMICIKIAEAAGAKTITSLMEGYGVPVAKMGRGRESSESNEVLKT